VFWSLQLCSEFLGVPEDSQVPFSEVWVATSHFLQSEVVTRTIHWPQGLSLEGSKWHIMSQCVYFAFRTIVFFGVLFFKKHVFLKRNFQMKCFETFWVFYLLLPQYVICFVIIKFGEIQIFESAQILLDFVFHFENLS
jgi:hypothetical protein